MRSTSACLSAFLAWAPLAASMVREIDRIACGLLERYLSHLWYLPPTHTHTHAARLGCFLLNLAQILLGPPRPRPRAGVYPGIHPHFVVALLAACVLLFPLVASTLARTQSRPSTHTEQVHSWGVKKKKKKGSLSLFFSDTAGGVPVAAVRRTFALPWSSCCKGRTINHQPYLVPTYLPGPPACRPPDLAAVPGRARLSSEAKCISVRSISWGGSAATLQAQSLSYSISAAFHL